MYYLRWDGTGTETHHTIANKQLKENEEAKMSKEDACYDRIDETPTTDCERRIHDIHIHTPRPRTSNTLIPYIDFKHGKPMKHRALKDACKKQSVLLPSQLTIKEVEDHIKISDARLKELEKTPPPRPSTAPAVMLCHSPRKEEG
jgi:hypothetical protein